MIIALVLRLGQRDPVDDDVGGGRRRSVVSRLIKSISSASCPGQHHKLTYCRITNVNSDFRKEALKQAKGDAKSDARSKRILGNLLGTLQNFTKDEVKQKEVVEKQKVSLMKVEEKNEREMGEMRKREAIFRKLEKLEEITARSSSERVKLEGKVNYLAKVVEDLHMEAEDGENCVRMTPRTANFGSTDVRFKKKSQVSGKKTVAEVKVGDSSTLESDGARKKSLSVDGNSSCSNLTAGSSSRRKSASGKSSCSEAEPIVKPPREKKESVSSQLEVLLFLILKTAWYTGTESFLIPASRRIY